MNHIPLNTDLDIVECLGGEASCAHLPTRLSRANLSLPIVLQRSKVINFVLLPPFSLMCDDYYHYTRAVCAMLAAIANT